MKAILIMPPKFFADFSNRVITRRHSFSQPITHSTMLRRRYASRSNSTGRADRSSFSFDGITGLMPKSKQVLVDPVGPIPLVPGQGHRPRDRLAVPVDDRLVGPHQQRHQGRVVVRLPGRQVEVERVTMAVAQQVEFRGEPAAGTAQRVVRWLAGIFFFAPPPAHRAARTEVPSMHHSSPSTSSASIREDRRRERIVSSVPSPFHLSKRSQTVPQGPNSSGRSRHGAPVLRIQRMPSTTCRRSRGGRPVRAGAGKSVTDQFPFAVGQSMPSQDAEPPWCVCPYTLLCSAVQCGGRPVF